MNEPWQDPPVIEALYQGTLEPVRGTPSPAGCPAFVKDFSMRRIVIVLVIIALLGRAVSTGSADPSRFQSCSRR
jgi:hypothetical protein